MGKLIRSQCLGLLGGWLNPEKLKGGCGPVRESGCPWVVLIMR